MDGEIGLGLARGDGGVLERSGLGLTGAALALALSGLAACGGDGSARAFPIPGERGGRVTVEVLNASGKPGLARAGALTLRRGGIDVVYFGNASDNVPLDSTRIVVRRGSIDAGTRVRAVLKVGRVSLDPDSTRLLDVTVLVGRDFAPRLDFHP